MMAQAEDKTSLKKQFGMARWLFRWGKPYVWVILLTLAVSGAYSLLNTARMAAIQPVLDTMATNARDAADELQIPGIGPINEAIKDRLGEGETQPDPEAASIDENFAMFVTVSLWALLITIPTLIFKYFHAWMPRYLTQRMIADIRAAVHGHVVDMSLRFHHDRKSGDLMSRVTNDIGVTEAALMFLFEDVLLQPFYILAALAMAAWASWELTVAAFIFLPLFGLPIALIGKRIRKGRRKSLEKMADVTQTMMQTYQGIRIVKSFNMEDAEKESFNDAQDSYIRKILSVMRRKSFSETIVELLFSLIIIITLIGGGYLALRQGLSVGRLGMFVVALGMINMPIRRLTKGYNRMQESFGALERIDELLNTRPEVDDDANARELTEVATAIAFDNVSFAYNDEPVLRNVSLTATRGQVTALVGPSGSGKSTMLDLICRFYDPVDGAILIDGSDLRTLQRQSILKHIAVVTQETFLFHTTIYDNIRYGRPEATEAEIHEAARAANIHDFILTQPEGYQSVVGERGSKLSGGQRQRIAIARAILKKPDILLLDEATSALDTESERVVQEALDNLMRGPITFVIAHRLSTIQSAEQILVLEDGEIVERGTHTDLLANSGVYARLHATQFQEIQ
jgi:subfamily B ATP-binding cassette protein MsbA